MLWNFLWVGLGGALGSMARYGCNLAFQGVSAGLPWGTLSANIAGSFVIGLVSELAGTGAGLAPEVRLFLATGICGGFTTLSSLMLEVQTLVRAKDFLLAGAYLALSLVVPFVALWGGILLVKGLAAK